MVCYLNVYDLRLDYEVDVLGYGIVIVVKGIEEEIEFRFVR